MSRPGERGEPHGRPTPDTARPAGPEPVSGRVFWAAAATGGPIMAFGVYGLLSNAGAGVIDVRPGRWLLWFAGGLLIHDGVVAPTVLLVGRGLRRAPVLLRTPLQVGLTLTGVITALAFPLVRGYARSTQPGNTSVLPGNRGLQLAVLLAVVWLAVIALAVVARRRALREGSQEPRPAP